jgi:uncharacterized protein
MNSVDGVVRPYLPRVIDAQLDLYLTGLAAISIEGAKGVGKTETARRRAGTCHRLDDPEKRSIVRADPRGITKGAPPVLVDEWQRVPETWDIVRRAVDDNSSPGQWILTGSAHPLEQPTHTGAGRIVSIRMRPMTLMERGVAQPTVSLADLLAGFRPQVEGETSLTLTDYVHEIVRSGLPELRGLPDWTVKAHLDGYIDRIIERDYKDMGGQNIRNPAALRRWLAAYAAATSMTSSYEVIRDASTSGTGDKPARSTTQPYQDVLENLRVLDPLPAWLPVRNRVGHLASPPKHHLLDPGLAARLLGAGPEALVEGRPVGPHLPRNGPMLGHLFESLVTLDIRVHAQAAGATVHHLRTHRGQHEVDLIVERDDHRVVAIEVKLARVVEDRDVRQLHWLKGKLGDDLLDAVVVNVGSTAFRRRDGIAVVPAALLGS